MADAAAKVVGIRRPSRPGRRWQPLRGNALEVLSLLGGVVLWEVLGRLLGLSWLPPISRVFVALAEFVERGVILGNVTNSLQALALGFGISVFVGLLVGALMGRYRRVRHALDIYVDALLISPSMVFAPIFFALFGLSDATRVAVIVMYSLFVIIINTSTGIRTVDPALVEMAKSYGASERQIFLRILLPGSLPLVVAGIQLGMGRAVKGMINGEMFIALVGLGALAQRYGSQFDAARVFAITMVVIIIALIANRMVQVLENRLTRWAD
jgi:NitT/TauT family transport system permease protein